MVVAAEAGETGERQPGSVLPPSAQRDANETREKLAKAEAAFEGTEGLTGEALLTQLDRVTSACSRITEKQSDHARAKELAAECESLRGKAIAESARAARGKLLKRVAVAAAVLLLGNANIAGF